MPWKLPLVARACTLAPAAVAEMSLPDRLAKNELEASAEEFWSLTEQGALRYQAGQRVKAPIAIRLALDRPITEQRLIAGNAISIRGGIATRAGVGRPFVVVKGRLVAVDDEDRVAWTASVGDGACGIALEKASASNLETADPEAVANAREDFLRQFEVHRAQSVLKEDAAAVVFEHGKPIFLPLLGRGLPLHGVFDGGLVQR